MTRLLLTIGCHGHPRAENRRNTLVTSTAFPHPALNAIHAYWDDRRDGREMPARREIDPVDLKEWLPNIFLVDVEQSPMRYRYRLVGTELTAVMGRELRGRYVDEMPFLFRKYAEAAYSGLARARQPVYRQINTMEAFRRVRYHRLLLPLSSDGADIDMVLGAIFRF